MAKNTTSWGRAEAGDGRNTGRKIGIYRATDKGCEHCGYAATGPCLFTSRNICLPLPRAYCARRAPPRVCPLWVPPSLSEGHTALSRHLTACDRTGAQRAAQRRYAASCRGTARASPKTPPINQPTTRYARSWVEHHPAKSQSKKPAQRITDRAWRVGSVVWLKVCDWPA